MRKKMLVVLLGLIFIVSGSFAATTGKIAGKVTEAKSGEGLPGVNVVIPGTQMGAVTDVKGNFFIINVPPGTYSVKTTLMGFGVVTKTSVQVKVDQTTLVDFSLQEEAISGGEVVVVAERPAVEIDLTASKEIMTAADLKKSFVADVQQAVNIQQGVNYHGGIRGGFGLDVTYLYDGMEMKDHTSGSNYTGMNTSAVQEMQLLTGGYNAEYGRASGAIVNVISRAARDRWHGSFDYQFRPAGIYHWGANMFNEHLFERTVMRDPNYWASLGLTDTMKPWERAALWSSFLNIGPHGRARDYADRTQHQFETTLTGPITSNLSIMASGRYKRGAPKFPGLLDYEPEWNGEVNLDYRITNNTSLRFKGMHAGFNNSSTAKTNYAGSEESWMAMRENSTYLQSGLSRMKYAMLGGGGEGGNAWTSSIKPPEYVRIWNGQLRLTHTFNPSTFLEAQLSHYQMWRKSDYLQDDYLKEWMRAGLTYAPGSDAWMTQKFMEGYNLPSGYYTTYGLNTTPFIGEAANYENWMDYAFNTSNVLKVDLTSQITPVHQIKAGLFGSYGSLTRRATLHHSQQRTATVIPPDCNPYEFAGYLQDKIETKGMIINLGVRIDGYNANKWVSKDIFDPLGLDPKTPGNIKLGIVSFGNPYTYERITKGGTNAAGNSYDDYIRKTPTQIAISPRIGISHPITETTVLHFMYGHFNQRPIWLKMVSTPGFIYTQNAATKYELNQGGVPLPPNARPDSVSTYYSYVEQHTGGNPAMDFERAVQWELGFEQNIVNLLKLDVTLYYKDMKDLTAAGMQTSVDDIGAYGILIPGNGPWLVPDVKGGDAQHTVGLPGAPHIWSNRYYQDVRGIEATLESQFHQWANVKVMYNMSFSTTGEYGIAKAYRDLPDDGITPKPDTRAGANNRDLGIEGNNNESWNPNNNVSVIANLFTPLDMGPRWLGIQPLGDWNLNFRFTWNQGFKYTYYPTAYSGARIPNNKRWFPRYNTDLKLTKGFKMGVNNKRMVVYANIYNVFNQKRLRLPNYSVSALEDYHERGLLQFTEMGTGDFKRTYDNVWQWYYNDQLPREIIFGLTYEF